MNCCYAATETPTPTFEGKTMTNRFSAAIVRSSLTICMISSLASKAEADGIESWQGATIDLRGFEDQIHEQGPKVGGAISGHTYIKYVGAYDSHHSGEDRNSEGYYRKLFATGTGKVEATGQASHLLSASLTQFVRSPGTVGGGSYPSDTYSKLSARWDGDSIKIRPLNGTTIPESIRLNFSIDYKISGNMNARGSVSLNENVINFSYFDLKGGLAGGISATGPQSSAFNIYDRRPGDFPWDYSEKLGHADAFLNLPIGEDGVSSNFDLGLELSSNLFAVSNTEQMMHIPFFKVALVGLYLPDGTALDSSRYEVSFTSGMAPPQTVPEVGTLLLWGFGVGIVAIAARRRAINETISAKK